MRIAKYHQLGGFSSKFTLQVLKIHLISFIRVYERIGDAHPFVTLGEMAK